MTDAGLHEIDLKQATDVTPPRAPVGDPLTGKERAGVNLTWGVLLLITIFISVMLVFLWTNEARSSSALNRILHLQDTLAVSGPVDTTRFRLVSAERASFRSFWSGLVQTVLLNVLLPVLTALLGYVFGTTQARAARGD